MDDEYNNLKELYAIAPEDPDVIGAIQKLAENVQHAKYITLFNDPADNNNAFLFIQAGAGGTEAQDWAQMIARMYSRWAERHDFAVEVVDDEFVSVVLSVVDADADFFPIEEGGIREGVMAVTEERHAGGEAVSVDLPAAEEEIVILRETLFAALFAPLKAAVDREHEIHFLHGAEDGGFVEQQTAEIRDHDGRGDLIDACRDVKHAGRARLNGADKTRGIVGFSVKTREIVQGGICGHEHDGNSLSG